MIFEAGGYARPVTALPRMVEGMGRPATVDHVRTISRDVQLRLAFALAESGYPTSARASACCSNGSATEPCRSARWRRRSA